jgi:hypothetical protein
MHRTEVRLPFLIMAVVGAAAAAGCEEEFSDDQFGTLDLAPVYDGSTPGDPAAGIPSEIAPKRGYLDGQVAEYYDFGLVPTIVDPTNFEPIAVRVQPMYFFFDNQLRPLWSRPVREIKDGTDWIKGGHDVLSPNPTDFCAGVTDADGLVACKQANQRERMKSYPLRQRDPLGDPDRGGVDDYQRPIVDLTPQNNDPPRRQYTGLWEVMEVITPGDYKVDSIKSLATLQRALDSKKYILRATGKVINCPLVDSRTYVNAGITNRKVLRPRIELWYRRQAAVCLLANGWETLGQPDGTRFLANSDSDRVDTFDVSRINVGGITELVVPVGRAYEPVVVDQTGSNSGLVRVDGSILSVTQPRRLPGDPGGYTPLRWMFDVPAPSDFQSGGWTSVSDVDPAKAAGRRGSFIDPEVRNLPLRGVAAKCSFAPDFTTTDPNTGLPLKQCGKKIMEPGQPTRFDPKGDPVCNVERDPFNPDDRPLECNKDTCFCDAPVAYYNQPCGPGLARCSNAPDEFSEFGYRCFPPWGGFCQVSCRRPGGRQAPNRRQAENLGRDLNEWVDNRCGGTPGFVCLESLATCIKFCDQDVLDKTQCEVRRKVGDDPTRDIQNGQTCQDFGLAVCAWPDTWTPEEYPFTQQ